MKRPALSVLLLMALMLSVLSGCGNKGDLSLTVRPIVNEEIVIDDQPIPEAGQPDDEDKPGKKPR